MNASKTVIGIDTRKRAFQWHGIDQGTGEIVSLQVKREKFLEHLARRARSLMGMEACCGSPHGARKRTAMGHNR